MELDGSGQPPLAGISVVPEFDPQAVQDRLVVPTRFSRRNHQSGDVVEQVSLEPDPFVVRQALDLNEVAAAMVGAPNDHEGGRCQLGQDSPRFDLSFGRAHRHREIISPERSEPFSSGPPRSPGEGLCRLDATRPVFRSRRAGMHGWRRQARDGLRLSSAVA